MNHAYDASLVVVQPCRKRLHNLLASSITQLHQDHDEIFVAVPIRQLRYHMAERTTASIVAHQNSLPRDEIDCLAHAITRACLEPKTVALTHCPFFNSFPLEIRNQVSTVLLSRANRNIEVSQIYLRVVGIHGGKGSAGAFRVNRQFHAELRDVQLKNSFFVQIFSRGVEPASLKLLVPKVHYFCDRAKRKSPDYAMRICVTDKSSTKPALIELLLPSLESLAEFCERVQLDDGAEFTSTMRLDWLIDLKSSTPHVPNKIANQQGVLRLFEEKWRNYKSFVILNAVDTDVARDVRMTVTGPRWQTIENFIEYSCQQARHGMDAFLKGDIAATMHHFRTMYCNLVADRRSDETARYLESGHKMRYYLA